MKAYVFVHKDSNKDPYERNEIPVIVNQEDIIFIYTSDDAETTSAISTFHDKYGDEEFFNRSVVQLNIKNFTDVIINGKCEVFINRL